MRSIIKRTFDDQIVLYCPRGCSFSPESFLPFFNDPEPLPDERENKRSQRRIFHFEKDAKKYPIKKFSYLLSDRFEDNFKGFAFRPTPSKMQMWNCQRIEKLGLETIFPRYVIEKRTGLRKESLFITPILEKINLFEYLRSFDSSMSDKLGFFLQAVEGITLLHGKGIAHRDAHAKNFLVDNNKLIWCDLDKMKKSRLILELKGRFRDCYYLLRSTAEAFILSGRWDEDLKKEVINIFETNYPAGSSLKEKLYAQIATSLKGFLCLT